MNTWHPRVSPLLLACAMGASACSVDVKPGFPDDPFDGWGEHSADAGADSAVHKPGDTPPVTTDQPSNSCADALDITSSVDSFYRGMATGRGSDPGSCSASGASAKGYYLVHIEQPGNYTLFANALAGFDDPAFVGAALLVRTQCDDAKSELACSNRDSRELRIGFDAPTTVYVVADGDVFAKAPFDLYISRGDSCITSEDCKGFASEHCNASGVCAEGGGDAPGDPLHPVEPACEGSMLDCDGYAANGCELDGSSDRWNCGACDQVCGSFGVNSYSACVNGTCVDGCFEGYLDCDGAGSNGCEITATYDPNNCGACGKVCKAPKANMRGTCEDSLCGVACDWTHLDCNGELSDGCECGAGDFATPACDGNVCKPTCAEGRGECDGDLATGCEADIQWDDQHCGGCQACGEGLVCNGGGCKPHPAVIANSGALVIRGLAADAQAVYWLEHTPFACSGRLMKKPYGSAAAPLATGLCESFGLLVDDDGLYLNDRGLVLMDKSLGTTTLLAAEYDAYSGQTLPFGDFVYYNGSAGFFRVPKTGGEPTRLVTPDDQDPYPGIPGSHAGRLLVANYTSILTPTADGKLEVFCDQRLDHLLSDGDRLFGMYEDKVIQLSDTCQPQRSYQVGWLSMGTFLNPRGNTIYFTGYSYPQQIHALDLTTGVVTYAGKSDHYDAYPTLGADGLYFANEHSVVRVPYEPSSN